MTATTRTSEGGKPITAETGYSKTIVNTQNSAKTTVPAEKKTTGKTAKPSTQPSQTPRRFDSERCKAVDSVTRHVGRPQEKQPDIGENQEFGQFSCCDDLTQTNAKQESKTRTSKGVKQHSGF